MEYIGYIKIYIKLLKLHTLVLFSDLFLYAFTLLFYLNLIDIGIWLLIRIIVLYYVCQINFISKLINLNL